MSNPIAYNPIPPRVWSRVQNQCTYINPSNSSYTTLYVPLINKTLPSGQAIYLDKQLYKGNILQYKGNSSNITKAQKYSQISKGLWCNRTKVFATQTTTYTNPNTTGLKRINSTQVPFPNQIVGSPNNISGPYQYALPNPNGCTTSLSIQDGGSLVCNAYQNQCTGEVTQTVSQPLCYPNYCSDVPGPITELCWNPKVSTYIPRQRYIMTNSLSKWPQGYKGFVSGATPGAPILTLDSYTTSTVVLTWNYISNNCMPISNFNVYQNSIIIAVLPYIITTTYTVNITATGSYTYYITSLSGTIESSPSNTVIVNIS
jgi:hypothetical protein